MRQLPPYLLFIGLLVGLPSPRPGNSILLYESSNLADYSVFAECNPGQTTKCPCVPTDAKIQTFDDFGAVTANVRGTYSFVNAIGNHKFFDRFSIGVPIEKATYRYEGQVKVPYAISPDVNRFYAPQAAHLMMQMWDGRAGRDTQEAVIYWNLNPWISDFGHVFVYSGKPAQLVDTGFVVKPDPAWHTFALVADFQTNRYRSVTVDGQTREIPIPITGVTHLDWRPDYAFILTTESESAWPGGENCPRAFGWKMLYRDMKLWREPDPLCSCSRTN